MPLSDVECRSLKPVSAPFKVSDGGGLNLLVQPNGSRLWRLSYRHSGRQKTLALGVYPAVPLAAARKARDIAKELLAKGLDPGDVKKREKSAARSAAEDTFRSIGTEWLTKLEKENRARATLAKKTWLLGLVDGEIGCRPITDLKAPEVLRALRRIEVKGHFETARRLRSTLSAVFRYAVATGRADSDPTLSLRGALVAPTVKHHAAITDPREIGALLRAIDGYRGPRQIAAALLLLPLLFARPGELRSAKWSEFDLENTVWRIPGERTKTRRPHRIPLSSPAMAILRDLRAITGDGELLFPSVRSRSHCISENTLNMCLRRLGYSKEEMTSHGFRSMAATRLNEMCRWHPDVIERALGHQDTDTVRRAYTSAVEYWPERVEMMQIWADYLDGLRSNTSVQKIA